MNSIKTLFYRLFIKEKPQSDKPLTGVEIIAQERSRQIELEGYSPDHDDNYKSDELAKAAASYALPKRCRNPYWGKVGRLIPHYWPWAEKFWKPCPDDRIRELAKAGALIAAEIDRLQRKKQSHE